MTTSSSAVAERPVSALGLRSLRERAGLSQSELALASGVSIETIKRIENGKIARPQAYTLRQLAAVLGQQFVVTQTGKDGAAFDQTIYQNTSPSGTPVMQVLVPAPTDPGVVDPELLDFVPLRQTALRGNIVGPVADMRVTHVYRFDKSVCARTIEALYRFPLPGDCAPVGVTVRFGAVEIKTSLEPRKKAEQQYNAAKQAGYQAVLTTRESHDAFTLKLTGIEPDEDVVVETHYYQLAANYRYGWQLRVPLVSAPRYVRADEAGTPAANSNPLQVWRDPKHTFLLDVSIEAGCDVSSPTHAITVGAGADTIAVALRDHEVVPDRDLVLRWQPLAEKTIPTLQVLTHEEAGESARYIMALVNPPSDATDTDIVPREILLLLDRSGSMGGAKWDAARWSVGRFLDGLRPIDFFNVGLFENSCVWMSTVGPVSATAGAIEQARSFVARHQPTGGTELGSALAQAVGQPRALSVSARQVLLVTDAQVSDAQRILDIAEKEAARLDRRRINVLCVDSAPNSYLVNQLADVGGGSSAFLTSSPDEEDITGALDEIVNSWSKPILADVQLVIETKSTEREARGVAATTRTVVDLGEMTVGRSQWVSAQSSIFSEPVVRLEAAGKVLGEVVLGATDAPVNQPAVRALFGAKQIGRLESLPASTSSEDQSAWLDRLGYADDPETKAKLPNDAIKTLLVRESLRYGIVCTATAFVGVREEAGHQTTATVEVPSAMPAGWDHVGLMGASRGLGMRGMSVGSSTYSNTAMASPPVYRGGASMDMANWGPSSADVNLSVGAERFLGAIADSAAIDTAAAAYTKRLSPRITRGGAGPSLPLDYVGVPSAYVGVEETLTSWLVGQRHFTRLHVGLTPATQLMSSDIVLRVYLGSRGAPSLEVSLLTLVLSGGERPMNVLPQLGERIRIALFTPMGSQPLPVGTQLRVVLS